MPSLTVADAASRSTPMAKKWVKKAAKVATAKSAGPPAEKQKEMVAKVYDHARSAKARGER